jgi:hypothetical protein
MAAHVDAVKPVCGICALEIVNEVHGSKLKQFHGEMAEDSRQRAIRWRQQHPNAQLLTTRGEK